MSSSAAKRLRKEEHLRALVSTTAPAVLARYAGEPRPIVASLRAGVEDATLPASQHQRARLALRKDMLRSLRAIEDRLDAAAPEHGDPAGLGGAGPGA